MFKIATNAKTLRHSFQLIRTVNSTFRRFCLSFLCIHGHCFETFLLNEFKPNVDNLNKITIERDHILLSYYEIGTMNTMIRGA